MDVIRQRQRHPRAKVLIVLHNDGFVEAFGRDDIDVKIVQMPAMPMAGELLAEEYLDLILSRPYKDVHWPGMVRAVGKVDTVTPLDLTHQERCVNLLRYCDHLLSSEVVEL